MRGSESGRIGRDERAVSEVIGAVLLVGIVLAGATLVVLFGASAIEEVRSQNQDETAELSIQEVGSRFDTLAGTSDVPRAEFDIGNTDPGNVRNVRRGHINVTVNRNMSCSTEVPLSSLRYENSEGETVAYEDGGIWRKDTENGSVMLSPPDLTFRNGSLDVTVVNLTGVVDDPRNEAVLNLNSSRRESRNRTRTLIQGPCIRPDNVTVRVQSDFYRAWGGHLETEIGLNTRVFNSNETTIVHIPQPELPRVTNDSANQVVNISNASYMSDVDFSDGNITVDKGVDNTYTVSIQPLSDGGLSIGDTRRVEGVTNITGPPTDVTFVMDVSGSMGNTDSDSTTREEEAKAGAKSSLTVLNTSQDRAGVVLYDQDTDLERTPAGERYLSSVFDSGGVNGTISAIPDSPGGGTHIWEGVAGGIEFLQLNSNQTRDRSMILLTDGKNDNCYNNSNYDASKCADHNQWTRENARRAAAAGITIYTIGYGEDDDILEFLLQQVANITGGDYEQATTPDELRDAFQNATEDSASRNVFARTPLTTNFTSGNNPHPPNIPGDTDEIAADDSGSETFLNVNDPLIDSATPFRHVFGVSGGETVYLNATYYECDEYVGTPYTRTNGTSSFVVTRCADLNESQNTTLGEDNISVYRDGDNVTHLLTNESAPWEQNLTQVLEPYMDADENLTLKSNQAIVIFDFPDGSVSGNRIAMLYEVGLAESDVRPRDILNIRVRNVDLEESD